MSRYAGMKSVFKREFRSYFATPLGYIFIVIFLFASGWLTVSRDAGRLLEMRQASLDAFFRFQPWIYLFLVPAVAMRLWAEERKTGTVELLFTLPITLQGSYLGKFFAGWAFLLIGLLGTWPIVAQVARLGDPDWGAILTGYLGCALLSATYLAVGMFFSALSKNQVVAFILGVSVLLILFTIGQPQTLEFIGNYFGGYTEQVLGSLSLIDHFGTLTRGLVEFRALGFFIACSAGWLISGMILLNRVKAS